jgi:hypothetical protein
MPPFIIILKFNIILIIGQMYENLRIRFLADLI